jgi:hypothetical protein
MRSFAKAILATAAVVAVLVPCAAHAQKASTTKLAKDVQRLRTDVELVKQAAVQVPTLAAAVADLDAKLVVIEQELATLKREQSSIPDARAGIDALSARVDALERAVASTKTNVAGLERPGVASTGGGGGGTARNGSFGWSTDDGAYAVTIGGYGQIRGQLAMDSETDATDTIDQSTLRVRRARVGAKGHLGSKDLEFEVLFDTLLSPSALDFYLDYKVLPELTVRAGQFKTQFISNFIASSKRLAFVERSLAVDGYRYDRDVQVGAHGTLLNNRLGYFASMGNASGRNTLNDNIDFNQVGRVEYAIVGELRKQAEGDPKHSDEMSVAVTGGLVHDLVALPDSVGGIDVNNDVDGNGKVDNVRVLSATAGAAFRYQGISATAEWFFRRESWGTIVDHPDNADLEAALNDLGGDGDGRNYQGFYLQGTYMVMPDFLLAGARIAHSRNTLLGVGGRTGDTQPLASRVLELDMLVQIYDGRFGGRALGLMYSWQNHNASDSEDPPGDHLHRFILETQFKF